MLPREIAAAGRQHWLGKELAEWVAVVLGESQGFVSAWHDNLDANGAVSSRDCGAPQINIPASEIGGSVEAALRTDSRDMPVWSPVFEHSVDVAWALYNEPWPGRRIRQWQPWASYTSGIAVFPGWWIWKQENGKPVGPWEATGRYVQRAIGGVVNYHLLIARDMHAMAAIDLGHELADALQVKTGSLYVTGGLARWKVPPMPSGPPADGVGPRFVPNDGTP
ncbi:MAG TPA: hypothetical protein VG265_14190 [Gaiellaceae bacterium]|nr:hypothetical protein [Gaiellaceae bacterium]